MTDPRGGNRRDYARGAMVAGALTLGGALLLGFAASGGSLLTLIPGVGLYFVALILLSIFLEEGRRT